MRELRFICLLEPTETWAVWDEQTGQPAVDLAPLTGLTQQAAEAACRALNRREMLMDELRALAVCKAS